MKELEDIRRGTKWDELRYVEVNRVNILKSVFQSMRTVHGL